MDSDPMVAVHIPDTGHVTTRYSGRYANRPISAPVPRRRPTAPRGVLPRPGDRPDRAPRADPPRPTGPAESHRGVPAHAAGTFGVRARPTGASDRPPRRPDADGNRRSDGHRGAAAGGDQAAARRPALAGSAVAPQVRRIRDRLQLNFLSCRGRPPPRGPSLPWRAAPRRLQHATVRDRQDPRAPPRPCRP